MIIGRADDLHVQAVLEAVESHGGSAQLLDAESLSRSAVVTDDERVVVTGDQRESVDLGHLSRGWIRRLAPEDWRDGVDPASHRGVVRSAWVTALLSLSTLADVVWLSGIDALYAAEDKLVQQRACRRLGIESPPAVLATRPELIPTVLGDQLVVKPLAAGHFQDDSGDAQVVPATLVRRDDDRLHHLAGAPFLVQRYVRARKHLRVVTVNNRAWVSELPAEPFPLDWRQSDSAHSSWVASERSNVARAAPALAAMLNVGYSSQDWVVDGNGQAHFLDLNPAGQWLFLPASVSEAVTDAVARWLLQRDG